MPFDEALCAVGRMKIENFGGKMHNKFMVIDAYGSDPSCFNNDGNGVIPVAILGSADFDVPQIDAGTVQLEGLAVAARGKANKLLAAYEDVNTDDFTDLVIKIEDVDGTFTQGSGTATLTGNLLDGTPILGTGDICITQP
jgi:hypothetical protein